MTTGNAILVVDLGNSETKCMVLYGKNSTTGKYRTRKFNLSNEFGVITENIERVMKDTVPRYDEHTTNIIKYDDKYYVNGEMQKQEGVYSYSKVAQNTAVAKYMLDSCKLSYRVALFNGYKAIMEMQHITDYNALKDITWSVVTLLPPGDVETGKEILANTIRDITELDMIFPEVKLPIKIEKVNVLPEGYCAYAGVVYDRGCVYRPEAKYLTDKLVAVIDIGAGTTDFLLIRNNKLDGSSRNTYKMGGNNVGKLVNSDLSSNQIFIDKSDLQNGLISGYISLGATQRNIAPEINNARMTVAYGIVSAFNEWLSGSININSIAYVLVVGGGALNSSSNEELVPIGKYIIDEINKISPYTALVELPKQKVQVNEEDGDVHSAEEPLNARELNLLGASYLAEIL